MSLPSVFSFISSSDAFWSNLTLDTIRNITSTCKGFQSEMLLGQQRIHLKHALLAMIKARPSALGGWALSFADAKYRFSLTDDLLIEHCAALPVYSKYHICVDGIDQYRTLWFSPSIGFMDAFQIAMNHPDGGLEFCMKQRHEYDIGVVQSANDLLEEVGDRFSWMVKNTQWQDSVEKDELRFDLRVAESRVESIVRSMVNPQRRILEMEKNVALLNSQKQALFERFSRLCGTALQQ